MKSIVLIFLFFLNCILINAQSKFAPLIGAEWHYYFKSNNYDANQPYFKVREGNLIIKYTKDTIINSYNFKKLESKEVFKFKGNDTLFSLQILPLYMTQRNDTVFQLLKDTLEPAFFYKVFVSAKIKIKNSENKSILNLELINLSDTSSKGNPNFIFKKYTYSVSCTCSDLTFENPLVILDRIGPLNADITVIKSQGQAGFAPDFYRLLCYQDNEFGELKFSNQECNTLVSNNDLNILKVEDLNIVDSKESIQINSFASFFRKVHVYDLTGKLVWSFNNVNLLQGLTISKIYLPDGILVITIEGENNLFKSKKFLNNN